MASPSPPTACMSRSATGERTNRFALLRLRDSSGLAVCSESRLGQRRTERLYGARQNRYPARMQDISPSKS